MVFGKEVEKFMYIWKSIFVWLNR